MFTRESFEGESKQLNIHNINLNHVKPKYLTLRLKADQMKVVAVPLGTWLLKAVRCKAFVNGSATILKMSMCSYMFKTLSIV